MGVSALVSSSRRITKRMFILDQFLVEPLHAPGEGVGVVLGGDEFSAASGEPFLQSGLGKGAIDGLMKAGGIIEIEEPAMGAVADESRRAGSAARDHACAGSPRFKQHEAEGLGNGGQH